MSKFKTSITLISTAMILTACEPISHLPLDYHQPTATDETPKPSENSPTEPPYEEETVAYTEYVAEVPEINNYETSDIIEAEECKLEGSLYTADERRGFSGDGYVTGFYGGSADYLTFKADIPSTQHYDITVCIASDEDLTNHLTVGDTDLAPFHVNGDGQFVRVTLSGVFMNEGETEIKINQGSANFDIDYIEISNNETVYEDNFEIGTAPEAKNLSFETKMLFKFLRENFGKKIITGQYSSGPANKELELIHKTTGKYPAIRFGDIGEYANGAVPSMNEIDAAIQWDERGGIVGLMWYWKSPSEKSSIYSKDSDFKLKSAVTETEVWDKDITELTEMCNRGKISKECLALISDIDKAAEGLDRLSQERIPVLWRPLHESAGSWYWWGADGPEAYKWLYDLMYKRLMDYHKLDNLIWIWNGQSEEYLVDSDQYDIAALDIYMSPNSEYGGRSEQYQWLKSITGGEKMLAIGECSTVPGIDEMCRDNSLWSFFGLWFGEYIENADGTLSQVYNKRENLIKIYNAENAVTLDDYAGTYGVGN